MNSLRWVDMPNKNKNQKITFSCYIQGKKFFKYILAFLIYCNIYLNKSVKRFSIEYISKMHWLKANSSSMISKKLCQKVLFFQQITTYLLFCYGKWLRLFLLFAVSNYYALLDYFPVQRKSQHSYELKKKYSHDAYVSHTFVAWKLITSIF